MRRSITVNFRYPFAPFSRTNQHLLGTLAKFSGLGRYFPTLTSVSIYQRPAVKSPENLPFSTPNLDLPRHGSIPMRHSGLQKDVLKLYRDLHRAARKKDPNDVDHFTSFGKSRRECLTSVSKNSIFINSI